MVLFDVFGDNQLGIFEGSEAAWDNADYHATWETLRLDFQLDDRFKDVSMKLAVIKEATRYTEQKHMVQLFFKQISQKNMLCVDMIVCALIRSGSSLNCRLPVFCICP